MECQEGFEHSQFAEDLSFWIEKKRSAEISPADRRFLFWLKAQKGPRFSSSEPVARCAGIDKWKSCGR